LIDYITLRVMLTQKVVTSALQTNYVITMIRNRSETKN